MPELPEVETVVRSIAPLIGRRIVSAEFRSLRVLRGGDPDDMAAKLAGRRIAGVERYGKFIVAPPSCWWWWRRQARAAVILMIHLGMTGKLLLGGPIGKHTHAVLTLDEGVLLFDDSRQFGSFQLSEEFPARVARLGPEPLEIPLVEFQASLKRHKTRIKSLLLNSTPSVRGVGNIYADEALFRAGIHPEAIANRLRGDRPRKLHQALRSSAARSYRRRRLIDLGLCGRAGSQRIFPDQSPRLPADGRTLCELRHKDPAAHCYATILTLLPEMSEALATNTRETRTISTAS